MPRNTRSDQDAPDTPAPDTQDNPAPDDGGMVEGEHNPFVNALLAVAKRLDDERDALGVKITANRESLRSMRTQNLLSPEQADAIEAFYPTRTRKPKNDNGTAATTEAASDAAPAAA